MVGIPGKSKGCHTCRRRKIKCDLTQPNCDRCKKSGKACEGYQRGPVFLNRTLDGLQKRQPMEEAQPRQGSHTQGILNNRNRSDFIDGIRSLSQERPSAQRIPPQIDLTILRLKKYETLFLDGYLPSHSGIGGNFLGLWLLESIVVDNPGPALEYAKQALFLARVGKLANDKFIITQGNMRYVYALKELQRALLNDHQVTRDETLAACQVLILFEVLQSTGSAVKGQISHMSGIVKLLKYRQCNSSRTPLSDALMDYLRYTAMHTSIQLRSLSLFGNLKAKEALWPTATTPEQKLYDKGFVFAGILEDLDRASIFKSASDFMKILDRCRTLNQEFACWYHELSEIAQSIPTWRAFLPQLQYESQETIQFPDIRLAHLMLCFWSLRMLLVFAMSLLFKHSPQAEHIASKPSRTEGSSEPTMMHAKLPQRKARSQGDTESSIEPSANGAVATASQLATLVLRAIPYCISDDVGLASCIRSTVGLLSAYKILACSPQRTEELQYCRSLLGQLSAKRGISLVADMTKSSGKTKDVKSA
ncbi:hypothetical protein LARI1_G006930 [Lachnellula arida]|uniref:Zn(2)-C6 fungal-type domain-containing protein n=1 Tax=Lachnellula arida TaxID=1316785 RepID=A0A8T9B6H0_9HELO|nr:hypothetical protein LARI1_G006930 [Lachnellula arida]